MLERLAGSWYLSLPVLGSTFFPGESLSNSSFSFAGSGATYWSSAAGAGPPSIKGGVYTASFGLPCLTVSSTCLNGVDQLQFISVGVGMPQWTPSFQDGVLTLVAKFTLPKQMQAQRRPDVPAVLTQDWHESSDPGDIVAKISDPNLRSNVEALIRTNAPSLPQYPRDLSQKRVSLAMPATVAPSALSAAGIQQLSTVRFSPEDPVRKQSMEVLRDKLKGLIPSDQLQRLTVPVPSASPRS